MTSALDLASMHFESLYELDAVGRLAGIREPGAGPPPRFALVRTAEGHRSLVRGDVSLDVASRLRILVEAEPPLAASLELPVQREAFRAALEAQAPVGSEYAGPAFELPEDLDAPRDAVRIVETDAHLLERYFEGPMRHLADRDPVFAVIEDDCAVAVCQSARRPSRGIEAGVMTAEGYRRRGYAARVVAAWAAEIRARGHVPLYSTWRANEASRATAARLGARLYGVDFSLT
ncbi:MAG: GNAT family N-acetyltransferase [Dehalococcoidia bacterium]|nr:GNAT family N-acetyltransferase [Dehalococcoidia bacterium]